MSIRLIDIMQAGFLDGSGEPLDSGTVTVYDAGTTNLRTVYQDFDLGTPHQNPLTLDSEGKAKAYTDQRVKLLVKNSLGQTVATIDNVGTESTDLTDSSADQLAGDGLQAPGDGTLAVNVDGVTLEVDTDTVRVKDSGISKAKFDATTTYRAEEISNVSIACSVGSNALTIALKSNAGSDCTATDFATIAFRSTTATSGVAVRRTITSALSLVISSGSTLGHTDGAEWPIYVYAIDDGGTVVLGASTSPFDERYVQSSSAEGGAGAADSVAAMYSTASKSNKAIRLLAILKSTQTTAGTWAAAPTNVSAPTAPHPLSYLAKRPSHTTVGAGGFALSASSGNFTTTTQGAAVAVTNLSVTITTLGGPVTIGLVADGSPNHSDVYQSGAAGNSMLDINRAGAPVARLRIPYQSGTAPESSIPASAYSHREIVAAGTYTYTVTLDTVASGGTTHAVKYVKLFAKEG